MTGTSWIPYGVQKIFIRKNILYVTAKSLCHIFLRVTLLRITWGREKSKESRKLFLWYILSYLMIKNKFIVQKIFIRKNIFYITHFWEGFNAWQKLMFFWWSNIGKEPVFSSLLQLLISHFSQLLGIKEYKHNMSNQQTSQKKLRKISILP